MANNGNVCLRVTRRTHRLVKRMARADRRGLQATLEMIVDSAARDRGIAEDPRPQAQAERSTSPAESLKQAS